MPQVFFVMLFYSHLVETPNLQIAFSLDLDLTASRSKSVLGAGGDVSNQQPFECFAAPLSHRNKPVSVILTLCALLFV